MPGWTRYPIPIPTRTSTPGHLWMSQRRASRSQSLRAQLPPLSWVWLGTSYAQARVNWKQAVMPSPSVSLPSPRGLRYNRNWSAEPHLTDGERLKELKLHGADAESQWACSFSVLIWIMAMLYGCCMPAAGCFYCCDVCELGCVVSHLRVRVSLNNACYSVLISYDDRRNEDAEERSGRRHSIQLQGFCRRTAMLPLKVTDINWTWLYAVVGSLLRARTLVSLFTQSFTSLGNDFTHCVLSSKQVMLQLTQTYLYVMSFLEGSKGFWQMVVLNKGIKAKDSTYAEARH